MISGYDQVMGRVIASLEDKGLADKTVIIYSADNGYYMGNRGFAGKWTHYEESLRVPMIIYDPRLPERKTGRTPEQMALNIDIPATILDMAGIPLPQIYQGASLMNIVVDGRSKDWRESFLCAHGDGPAS